MGKMSDGVKLKIQELPNEQIQALLLEHFVEHANKSAELFTKQVANDRPTIPEKDLEQKHIINIVLRNAPTIVCEKLADSLVAMKSSTNFVNLFSAATDSKFDKPLLTTVMNHAPQQARLKIAAKIKRLREDEIIKLLFCNPPNINYFLELINTSDSQSSIHIVEALSKIDAKKLLSLLLPDGFIELFKKQPAPSQELALALLKLLDNYAQEDLLKLLYGSTQYVFNRNNRSNLFHIIFNSQSETVISALLEALMVINEEDAKKLLSQRNDQDKTPIESAFARTDNSGIDTFIIRTYHSDENLRSLFTEVSYSHPLSIMQTAVNERRVQAVACYLEQPGTQKDHLDYSGTKTMSELAKKKNHKEMITIFDALPLLELAQSPPSTILTEDIESRIKANPDILTRLWGGNRTVLHFAASSGHTTLVEIFLRHKLSAYLKDDQGHTAVDEALANNQLQTLKSFTLHINQSILTAFANTLNNAKLPINNYEELEQVLEQRRPISIMEYCSQENDCYIHFLTDIARLFLIQKKQSEDTQADLTLENAIKTYIKNHLQKLQNCSPIQHKALQLHLIILLFSLPTQERINLLSSLTLNQEEKTELGLVLSRALVQPAIYKSQQGSDHFKNHQLIKQLIPYHSNVLESIANIHLQNSDLSHFPAETLQEFAKLCRKSLISFASQRICLILTVLTIEQILQTNPIDEDYLKVLFSQFEKEFHRTYKASSSSPEANARLQLVLNLATQPRLKLLINQLSEKTKPIHLHLKQSLINSLKNITLIPGSLLSELVRDYACSPEIWMRPENHQALNEILAASPSANVIEIIQSIRNNLSPRLVADSLSAAAKLEPRNDELNTWIHRLENKRGRLDLATEIEQVDKLHQQTLDLANLLVEDRHAAIKKSLTELTEGLQQTSDSLFFIHLDQTDLAWELIETHFLHLSSTLQTLQNQLKDSSFFESDDRQLRSELQQFASSEAITALNLKVTALCKRMDQHQQTVNQNQATIKKELDSNPEKTNLLLNQLNQQILRGIWRNPQRNQLLPALFQWTLSCGYRISSDALYHNMARLIQTTNPAEWIEVDKQIEHILYLKNGALPVLLDLQIALINPPTTLNNLITALYSNDETQLTDTIALCDLAQLHDFKNLVEYVLHAKRQNLPVELLRINPKIRHSDVSHWIEHILTSVDSYTSQSMSFKLLKTGVYRPRTSEIEDKLQMSEVQAQAESFKAMLEEQTVSPHPQAILALIATYAPKLESKNRTLENRLFILKLDLIFKQAKSKIIVETINKLPPETLKLIINNSLLGLNSDDAFYSQACRDLLNNLCAHAETSPESLGHIKEYLGQQDVELLGDAKLIEIAKDILKEEDKKSLSSFTINAIWIQRLLTNPRFVAALKYSSADPAKVLQLLLDRYRYYSMILKQDEYERLSQFLKGEAKFPEESKEYMEKLRQEILVDKSRKKHLFKKLELLLQFRSDDCIRALLNQLENNCRAIENTWPEVAEAASEVLFTHYNNRLAGARDGVFYKIADYVVRVASEGKGDFEQERSTIVSWLKTYLPHKNFEQSELTRKQQQQPFLYDQEQRKIGFINEANYAMSLDTPPRPLLGKKEMTVGLPFYDRERRVIGTLTNTGQVQQENLFQKYTSAMLIATVPQEKLEESSVALGLLVSDIFSENSLEEVYEKADPSKHEWITTQVAYQLATSSKPIQAASLQVLVSKHSPESLFSLLANIELYENAEQLFEIILSNPALRRELFVNQALQKYIFEFFKRHDTGLILANFLANHSDKSWFNDGFQLLGIYAKDSAQPDLLISALEHLSDRTFTEKTLTEDLYNRILTTLLSSEGSASIIWKFFLKTAHLTPIQSIDTDLSEPLTSFFFKHHCTPAIEALNRQNNLTQTDQHRLLLLIFAKQREQLFHRKELRFSSKIAWSKAELEQMSTFLKRHFHQHLNADENLEIGKEILAELVFRCANFGLTSLFYHNEQFDPFITTQTVKRSLLNAIAAKEYLPKELKEAVSDIYSTVLGWFDPQHQQNDQDFKLLEKHQAIIDWKELCNQAWEANSSMTELPLISAYLINYTGNHEPLVRLIKDYIAHPRIKANPNYLKNISQVMAKFPQRDLSNCIFTALEELITENPSYLSEEMFNHMAQFYTKKFPEKSRENFSPEINLINHFGQQQKYNLVLRGCELLSLNDGQSSANDLLKKINNEAKVESFLSGHLTSWYYPLLKFFIRFWNYGFSTENNASQVVSLCDQKSTYTSPAIIPPLITTPVKGGEEIEQAKVFAEQASKLKEKYSVLVKQVKAKEEREIRKEMEKNARKDRTAQLPSFGSRNYPGQFTCASEITQAPDFISDQDAAMVY
ncbi:MULTISPECIES: ankyrin repeat domain-containing protein [Legionella]|uniref:Dot/Icm T4SS effector n=1 Tax=Legionella drozanskii LLAP-1 TaxID=1212489 RepID=A0A0W0TC37_9GAMM|nr:MULTISPECIES: ankyrin repeat domain-containing protein [Legionella]KTC92973.1 Dot/Icm T4SS effector [Legionella drozanskii LLAP-1]PJE11883.1 MAG: ankyrin repeat domain-containing protein [Legionella sp.]